MQADASGKPGVLEGSKEAQQHLATIADYRDLVKTPTKYAEMVSAAGGDSVKVLQGILAITDPKLKERLLAEDARQNSVVARMRSENVRKGEKIWQAYSQAQFDKGLVPDPFSAPPEIRAAYAASLEKSKTALQNYYRDYLEYASGGQRTYNANFHADEMPTGSEQMKDHYIRMSPRDLVNLVDNKDNSWTYARKHLTYTQAMAVEAAAAVAEEKLINIRTKDEDFGFVKFAKETGLKGKRLTDLIGSTDMRKRLNDVRKKHFEDTSERAPKELLRQEIAKFILQTEEVTDVGTFYDTTRQVNLLDHPDVQSMTSDDVENFPISAEERSQLQYNANVLSVLFDEQKDDIIKVMEEIQEKTGRVTIRALEAEGLTRIKTVPDAIKENVVVNDFLVSQGYVPEVIRELKEKYIKNNPNAAQYISNESLDHYRKFLQASKMADNYATEYDIHVNSARP